MKSALRFVCLLAGAALAAPAVRAATYEADTSHSHIGFAVKHLLVSTVRGEFDRYTATVDYDPANPTEMRASARIEAASINTKNQKRDDHLRSPDFLDAAQFPDITFEATRVEGSGNHLTLIGNLTIRGVTREISLPITINGPVTDPWGNERIGFEGSTTINRMDYGVSWSKTMDAGGLVVGENVKLEISFEGVKQ